MEKESNIAKATIALGNLLSKHSQKQSTHLSHTRTHTHALSRPLRNIPLLPLLLALLPGQLLLVVYARRRQGSGVEQPRAGDVDRARIAGVGHDAAGLGGVREALAQGVLAVPLAQVVAAPDAAADPDAGYGDDDDDEEYYPLVVCREPGCMVRKRGVELV